MASLAAQLALKIPDFFRDGIIDGHSLYMGTGDLTVVLQMYVAGKCFTHPANSPASAPILLTGSSLCWLRETAPVVVLSYILSKDPSLMAWGGASVPVKCFTVVLKKKKKIIQSQYNFIILCQF